ncbi:MAG: tetratricopeptide repeat protein [Myxococcaceae bacterium]
MDVRCERCKTLYELDEARVSDAGTTVRCTSCGHVFRVRKKVLLMTEAVGAGGESAAVPPPIVEKPPWRVRSPNGRVIAFRELTSMQKWIVERKFGRDDEISLHGDHWKRLGDIAELQPFFLLLEEVDRVHELEERLRKYELPDEAPSALERALSPLAAEPVRPTPTPIRLDAPIQQPPEPASGNGFAAMGAVPAAGPEASGGPERIEEAAPPAPWTEPPRTPPPSAFSLEDIREATRPSPEDPPMPEGTVEPQAPAEEADQPEFTRRAGLGVGTNPVQDTDDWEPPRPSSKASWVAAVLIVGAIAVAAAAYLQIWVPAQEEKLRQEAERARVDQSQRSRAAEDADARERERKAKEELVAGMAARADAGTATSTPAVVDAGTGGSPPAEPAHGSTAPPRGSAAPVAPVTPAPALARAKPPGPRARSFDDWMAQGDREREHARARAALNAYDRAIRVEPSRPEAYVGQGRALLTLGDSRSAIAAFRKALGVNSRYSVAEFWLGEAHRRAGQNAEAAAAFGRYLEAAPEGAEAAQAREALNGLP